MTEKQKKAIQRIHSGIKELKRIMSEAWYEGQLPNQWYGSGTSYTKGNGHGNYKGKTQIVWGEAANMAADECYAAIKALKELLNAAS